MSGSTRARFVVIGSAISLLLSPLAHSEIVRFDPWDGLIEQDTRVQVMQGLCSSLKANYAGWELKKRVMLSEGYSIAPPAKDGPVADGDRLCADAIARERKAADPSTKTRLLIAQANLSFRDRVLKLGAAFRDSHLRLTPVSYRTPVQLGINLRELGGKFYVSSVTGYVQSYLSMSGQPVPQRGAEALSIGGDTIAEARDELLPYISASTERFALNEATSAITGRNFSYPSAGRVELKWKDAAGVERKAELPWLYGMLGNTGSPLQEDDAVYLKHIGAVELGAAFFRQTASDGKRVLLQSERLDEEEREQILEGHLENTQTLYDVSGSVLAHIGLFKNKFLFIQVRNFMDWQVAHVEPALQLEKPLPASAMRFEFFLKTWLQLAAENGLPVILDLRNNGGGDAQIARDFVANFVPAGGQARPTTEAFPVTSHNRFAILQYFNPLTNMQRGGKKSAYEEGFAEAYTASYTAEQAQRLFMSPLHRHRLIESAGLFKTAPRLFVWVGPNCVSACEAATMMLAGLKNTTILGSALNGTGMGQVTIGSESGSVTASEPNGLFHSTMLPNTYFGAPSSATMDAKGIDAEAAIDARVKRISENRPLKPAVAYAEQLIDLQQNGLGWLQATERQLTPASSLGSFLTNPAGR